MGTSNRADKALYVLSEDGTVPPTDNAATLRSGTISKSNSQFYGKAVGKEQRQ